HRLETIELRPRLEQIERCIERPCARGVPGRLVIAPPQPGSKPLAVDRPGFAVAVDLEISVCGAGGGMEQLVTGSQGGEHPRPLRWAPGCPQKGRRLLAADLSRYSAPSLRAQGARHRCGSLSTACEQL